MPASQVFEQKARAAKVAKILAFIPPGASPAHNDFAARVLAVASGKAREQLAALAGAKAPSNETWAAVVAAVRVRS